MSKIWLSALIAGLTCLIIYFAGKDACKVDSCPTGYECRSIDGFNFECVIFECEANPCCESSIVTALCCENGVCSNDTFIFNGTNADECKCLCTDNFTGLTLTAL